MRSLSKNTFASGQADGRLRIHRGHTAKRMMVGAADVAEMAAQVRDETASGWSILGESAC